MKPSHLISICLLLHVLFQIDGQIQNSGCGRLHTKNLTPLLAHGFSSNNHWPWHAAIYHRINQSDPTYQCGGTVITTRSVLTAAHCVSHNNVELNVQLVSVALGRLNLAINESTAQSFEVSEILIHPEFNSIYFPNDIAIIRLSAHAIFNNYVRPICLWKSDKTNLSEVVGKMGTVIGWGLTENGTFPSMLQQVNFPVADLYTCLKSNPLFFGDILTKTNFCAGSRNGTALCRGDSGGSIAFEENGIYYIRGIVSVGQEKPNPMTQKFDCDLMQYAVFTDVAQFLPWIVENTGVEREPIAAIERELLPPIFRMPNAVEVETDFSICGQLSPGATPLITNASIAHHWPWHAAIYHVVGNSDPEYKCGGTLINSRLILTAAHCVQVPIHAISVSMGRLNLTAKESSDQTFGVAEVILYPNYRKFDLMNDIAIIELSTRAKFNHYVRPVCLWNSSNTEFSEIVGKTGTIVGWGRKKTGERSDILQEAMAPLVGLWDCYRSNSGFFLQYLTDSNFCAGRRNGTGACAGDTGGSIILEENGIYYIRGIAALRPSDESTEEFTCDPTNFTIFTDVAKYLQWIKNNQ